MPRISQIRTRGLRELCGGPTARARGSSTADVRPCGTTALSALGLSRALGLLQTGALGHGRATVPGPTALQGQPLPTSTGKHPSARPGCFCRHLSLPVPLGCASGGRGPRCPSPYAGAGEAGLPRC